MRVLHVSEAYGGGIATVMEQYMASLPEADHRLVTCLRSADISPSEAKFLHSNAIIARDVRQLGRLARVESQSADVIHLHSAKAGAIGRLASRDILRRTVYSPHALPFLGQPTFSMRQLSRPAERILAFRTAGFGAVSEQERDLLKALGVPKVKISVVPHAFERQQFVRVMSARENVVVGVGRITFQKNPQMFAQIARIAMQDPRTKHLQWVWIGDGDSKVRRALEEAGVSVSGWLPRREVLDRVSRASLMVHTARYEGLPVAVLETLNAGTPVIGLDIPSVREIAAVKRFSSLTEAQHHLASLLDKSRWQDASDMGMSETRIKYCHSRQAAALVRLYSMATL